MIFFNIGSSFKKDKLDTVYLHIVSYKRPSCTSSRPLAMGHFPDLFASMNVSHGGNRVMPFSLLRNGGKSHDSFRRYKEKENLSTESIATVIKHQTFSLPRDWSLCVTSLNMPQRKKAVLLSISDAV